MKKISTALSAFMLLIAMIVPPAAASTTAPAPAPDHNSFTNAKAFVQVEAGSYYSIGLRKDGSVWVWGRNLWGELGLQEKPTFGSVAAPVRIKGLDRIVSISGGRVAVHSDGTVWEWGMSAGAKTVAPRQIAGLEQVSKVADAGTIRYALHTDGSVTAWTASSLDANTIELKKLPVSQAAAVAASGSLGIVVKKDGTVWWWTAVAEPDHGLLLSEPVKAANVPRMKQVSIDPFAQQVYGVDPKGGAWVWGYEPNVPANGGKPSLTMKGKPMKLQPKLQIKEIKAGAFYCLLLTTKGEVWSFGTSPWMKQGKVKGLPAVRTLDAGEYHGQAIDEQGRVWGWGADKWNEVGTEPTSGDGMVYRPVMARQAIDVKMNGRLLSTIFPALAEEGTVLVPLKDTAREIGADFSVSVDSNGFAYYELIYGDKHVILRPNESEAISNETPIKLPVQVRTVSGAVMVPMELLRQLGLTVNWDSKDGVVLITY